MGNFASAISSLFGTKEAKIAMIGLDGAGKTTVIYQFQLGEVVTTIPTIGFNVENVEYKKLKFTIYDVGGQARLRPLWRYYYQGVDAIIFVVDSCDTERLALARDELARALSDDDLRDAHVLVFANKQDMPQALSTADVTERLQLHKQPASRNWYVQGCSATKRSGLFEGMDWLSAAVKKTK
jgi:Arf/Sar family protein